MTRTYLEYTGDYVPEAIGYDDVDAPNDEGDCIEKTIEPTYTTTYDISNKQDVLVLFATDIDRNIAARMLRKIADCIESDTGKTKIAIISEC
jgi:hypothetical protein